MARYISPVPQYLDAAGDPLALGKLFFFVSGTNDDLATFADVNETIPNTQPVLLTGDGRAPNIFYSGAAKVILTDQDDVQIWSKDPVTSGGESGTIGDDWDAISIYQINSVVDFSGVLYVSIINQNQNQNPATSPEAWTEFDLLKRWNPNETYKIGDPVTIGGNLYVSTVDSNLNNDPLTDLGPNWTGFNGAYADQFYLAGGIVDAYTLTAISPKIDPTSLIDGMRFSFIVPIENTGASTINVAGLGIKSIKNRAGLDLIAGDMNVKTLIVIRFDLANDEFVYDDAKIRALVTRNSSNQSIATGVNTSIVFDTVLYDSGNLYSGAADEFIIPTGFNKVRLVGNALWDANATGTRRLRPEINGSAIAGGGEIQATPTASGATGANVASSELNLMGADSVKLTVLQDSGGPLDVIGISTVTFLYIEVE